MSTQKSPTNRSQDEAAEWLVRLGNRSITPEMVREFGDWRDDPANDAAYQEAEAFWETSAAQAGDPGIMQMTAEALARGKRARPAWYRRPPALWGLAMACVTVAAVSLYLTIGRPPSYTTGPSEQRLVRLDDGTWVRLNVNSRIEIKFTPGERRLSLTRGEAFFDVAHDAKRPFYVTADKTQVRAVGTKFDVRDHGDFVQVTLVEGRVKVRETDKPAAWTLDPNQKLVVPDRGQVTQTPIDASQSVSWTTGRLAFQDTPLADAVAEVNRYGKDRIVIEGDALGRRPVSGFFDVGDTASFVKGVSVLFDLQATPANDGVITLRDRPGTGA